MEVVIGFSMLKRKLRKDTKKSKHVKLSEHAEKKRKEKEDRRKGKGPKLHAA